jgi:hypothetical protein
LFAGKTPEVSPVSTFSAEANPTRPACGEAWHLRYKPDFNGGSHSSRCRSRP